jgi:hypothetical protein
VLALIAPVAALGPAEKGVKRTRSTKKEGPMYADTHTTETLYRVRADGLAKVFEVESDASVGEADRIMERTLAFGDTASGGFYDLEVTTTKKDLNYHGGESTQETETARYRWDGKAYAPVE